MTVQFVALTVAVTWTGNVAPTGAIPGWTVVCDHCSRTTPPAHNEWGATASSAVLQAEGDGWLTMGNRHHCPDCKSDSRTLGLSKR